MVRGEIRVVWREIRVVVRRGVLTERWGDDEEDRKREEEKG